jgi:hypothetical protein
MFISDNEKLHLKEQLPNKELQEILNKYNINLFYTIYLTLRKFSKEDSGDVTTTTFRKFFRRNLFRLWPLKIIFSQD